MATNKLSESLLWINYASENENLWLVVLYLLLFSFVIPYYQTREGYHFTAFNYNINIIVIIIITSGLKELVAFCIQSRA